MDKDKEHEEISLIGRLFSLEALLILMGFVSIVAGLVKLQWGRIIVGVLVIGAAVLLNVVRKKESKKK